MFEFEWVLNLINEITNEVGKYLYEQNIFANVHTYFVQSIQIINF